MRLSLLAALLVLYFSVSAALAQGARPIPAGVRQGEQAVAQGEKDIPPPTTKPKSIDMDKLNQEADELARVAQTIPPDVANLQKGIISKDMIQRLKQIEKISKHLRSQLDH